MTPDDLPAQWREQYEERAAIMEYEAKLSRMVAERFAMRETEKRMKLAQDKQEELFT